MKKAIVFTRVSSLTQSLEDQQRAVMREALTQYKSDEIAVVEGKESAVKLEEEQRQTLQEMKSIINQHPTVETIFFFGVDRLARRVRVVVDVVDDLTKMGVNCVFLNPSKINTIDIVDGVKRENPMGHLILLFLGYAAEMEAKMFKARVVNTKKIMRANHQVASGTLAYGYRKSEDKTIEVCEPQASIVRELFNLYATKQWSLITLHDHLATKDDSFFKLSSQSSTRACRVSAIIHNTLYSGNNTKNSNVYPPIVTPQLQEDCIAIANANLKGIRQNTKYIFYGKGLLRNYSDPRHRLLTAEIGQCCYRTNRDDSPKFMVSANAIDTILKREMIVLKPISLGEARDKDIEQYKLKIEENNKAIDILQKEIDKLNASNLRVETLLAKGKIRESIADEQKKVNDKQIRDFNKHMVELKTENSQLNNIIDADKEGSITHATFWEIYNTTDDKLIKKHIDSVVDEVRVYNVDKFTKRLEIVGKPHVAHLVHTDYIVESKGGRVRIITINKRDPSDQAEINVKVRFIRKRY